jgi:plasmid stabilization system protein ParE
MTEGYKVQYSPAALDDLKSIYSYIAITLKAKQAAVNQVKRIRQAIRSFDTFPERYAQVDWEPWASMGMHKAPVDHYIVFYQVSHDRKEVTAVRIFYGGRDIEHMIGSE